MMVSVIRYLHSKGIAESGDAPVVRLRSTNAAAAKERTERVLAAQARGNAGQPTKAPEPV